MSSLLSFNHKNEDDFYEPCVVTPRRRSCSTSPKTSRKNSPCSTSPPRTSTKTNKNPYANRGLDKFNALLADIQEKKQKIFLQKDSHNISLVRFVYSSSKDDIVPIVIMSKEKNQAKPTKATFVQIEKSEEVKELCLEPEKMTKKTDMTPEKNIMGNLKHPSYYVPLAVILILLLMIFGRSAAILVTSIGWYMVPIFTDDTLNAKRPRKKSDHLRKGSEIKMVNEGSASPKNESPLRKHGHRKSW